MENLRLDCTGGKTIENAAERGLFMRAARVLDRMIKRRLPAGEE